MSAGGGVGRGPLLSEGMRGGGGAGLGGQQESEQRNQPRPGDAGAAPLPSRLLCSSTG